MRISIYFLLLVSSVVIADDIPVCGKNCTFVLKSEKSEGYKIVNKDRSNRRLSPFSTFKIANSLIALETGTVKSLAEKLTIDRSKYPIQKWWRKSWYENPLSIKEAFKYSAFPIYQQIANQIGDKKMTEYITKFQYGNADISSDVDSFWLNGSLKISAKEQVEFLQRLNSRKLPVSEIAIKNLKDIMLVESTEKYKLYAKTGAGYMGSDLVLGWYVGFLENESGIYYFALNVEGTTFTDVKKITRRQLKQAGVIL